MIGRPLPGAALALGLVILSSLAVAMLVAPMFGLAFPRVVPLLFEVTLPGLAGLGGAVFWRLHTGATRPSWPFIFTAAGLVNVFIWAILTLFLAFNVLPEGSEPQIDITSFFPFIALGISLVWAICGGVFGWLEKRGHGEEGRG